MTVELVGIDKQLNLLREKLRNWKRGDKPPLLVGSPGTGKTASVYKVAKELGLEVWVVDFSDDVDEGELTKAFHKKLQPTLLLIENVDLAQRSAVKILKEVLERSCIPVVLTANNLSNVPQEVVDRCEVVHYFKLRARDLLKIAEATSKDLNMKPNYEALSGDARQALMSVYGSCGYEGEKGLVKKLEEYLKAGEFEDVDDKVLIYLLDSSYLNFYGAELFLFVKAIALCNKSKNRGCVLNGFKVEKPNVAKSYFLTKARLLGEE